MAIDGMQIDAWTRRRLGLATSGIAAAVIGLNPFDMAGKKKRKKKKRCRKLLETCSTTGSGPRCCNGLNCDVVGVTGLRCCHGLGNPCEPTDNTCCSHLGCDQTTLSSDFICCANPGEPCAADIDCCGEALCNGGLCDPVE